MNSEIKKVLKKIEQNGFEGYIVGGFVRDYLLCRASNDIDIATNARPKDIANIFGNSKELGNYGSYNLKTNHYNYDITTYRREKEFIGRNPREVIYTNNLMEDLQRRDFTMNAICMNSKGKIIDVMHGVEDMENKQIRMIGNPKKRLKEDPLRILRAIRFASNLDFELETNLKESIQEQAKDVLTLSNYRIKQEIDSILINPNFQKGLNLLEEFGILELLEIYPQNITYVDDVNGMWAQIITTRDFKETKNEKKQIEIIKEILTLKEISAQTIFDFGLYPTMVAAKIKGISKTSISKIYKKMPIKEYQDLNISFQEIKEITQTSNEETKKIQTQIIHQILNHSLKNKKEIIKKYLKGGLK